MATLTFTNKKSTQQVTLAMEAAQWFVPMLAALAVSGEKQYSLAEMKASYEAASLADFELFWDGKPVNGLWASGLLTL